MARIPDAFIDDLLARSDIVELLRVDISGAVWDMMALRAAVGYAMFHFAFSLRAGNESPPKE